MKVLKSIIECNLLLRFPLFLLEKFLIWKWRMCQRTDYLKFHRIGIYTLKFVMKKTRIFLIYLTVIILTVYFLLQVFWLFLQDSLRKPFFRHGSIELRCGFLFFIGFFSFVYLLVCWSQGVTAHKFLPLQTFFSFSWRLYFLWPVFSWQSFCFCAWPFQAVEYSFSFVRFLALECLGASLYQFFSYWLMSYWILDHPIILNYLKFWACTLNLGWS